MKFLLVAINAKYIHSNPAVYSLKSMAGKYKDQVEIAEFTINHRPEQVIRRIYETQTEAIGFSCYIWNIAFVRRILVDLKKLMPDTDFWLGGPEVSYDAFEEVSQWPQLRGIMYGEGELTFRQLMAAYCEGWDLNVVKGIVYRSVSGEICFRQPQEMVDMSEIPFVYSGENGVEHFENRIVYYESSRGCPFQCSYCLSSIDRRVRFRNLDLVKEELGYFLEKKVPQVKFIDRTFNCNHQHAMEIWRYILEHDNQVTNFHFEISADLLREDELELLSQMRPGAVQMEIGVQTTNPLTTKEIRRSASLEQICNAVHRINSFRNIHLHLDLIAGLPYEDYDSFHQSFNDVYGLYPEQLQLGFLKVLKGSHMYEMAEEYGLVYETEPVYEVLYTKWLSYQEKLRLKNIEEMVEVYYNSRQYQQILLWLETYFEDAFFMYEALGDFYEKKHYMDMSHSRLRRYEILLEWIGQYKQIPLKTAAELLTFDWYSRENAKTRPSFSPDNEVYQSQAAEFFKKEEKKRNYLPDYKDYTWKQMMHMTHLEYIEAEIYLENGKKQSGSWYLFDYMHRNPLTGNANIFNIKIFEK
ncbi:MAG: B12-binding domain-containing radical SAM protein [Lachnospiraceae bacterium]